MKKLLITLATLAVSAGIAVGGAAPAQAQPQICGTGPWGYVVACVQGPGWVDWNPWNNWHGGWGHGNKHWNPGHGHWK